MKLTKILLKILGILLIISGSLLFIFFVLIVSTNAHIGVGQVAGIAFIIMGVVHVIAGMVIVFRF